jgi:GT2 family glycosyltransferase
MLSIVIPTQRRVDLLTKCLASVTRHAPKGTQIVVVDDGSPSGKAGNAARQFDGVQVVRQQGSSGFASAANAGIRASQGDIIELLNDDTEVTAGWAEAAMKAFADPALGAVAPLVLQWPTGQIIDSAGDCYYEGGIAGKRGHGETLSEKWLQGGFVFGASAAAAFYRRSALDKVGLFPEEFGSYFEDVDLSFRLQRGGYRIWYEPASRVLHHGGATHGYTDDWVLQQQSRNEELVFWRNVPGSILWRAVPKHLAVLAGKALRRWREGTLGPFLLGRLQALRRVANVRRYRASMHDSSFRARGMAPGA